MHGQWGEQLDQILQMNRAHPAGSIITGLSNLQSWKMKQKETTL